MRFRRHFGALAVLLVAAVLAPQPATADPIEDKKAEAARIATRLEELRHQVEVIAEAHNDAVLELESLRAEFAAAQTEHAATEAEMALRQQEVQAY
ncbi:MAG: hypothetical protein L0206_21155, partial [Actinobacteria bacterium]|nr:hypothetical protein [Actinomycetota bacterium]